MQNKKLALKIQSRSGRGHFRFICLAQGYFLIISVLDQVQQPFP